MVLISLKSKEMTDKQPTALRLAGWLEKWARDYAGTQLEDMALTDAAAELRRLHEANEAFGKRQEWWNERMFELEQQRNELLEALKMAWPLIETEKLKQDGSYGSNFVQAKADRIRAVYEKARAAIASAEGKQ